MNYKVCKNKNWDLECKKEKENLQKWKKRKTQPEPFVYKLCSLSVLPIFIAMRSI